MKKNEQTRDVRDLVSLASDSDSLASFICKFARLGIEDKKFQHPNTFYLHVKIGKVVVCNNAFSIRCPVIDLNSFLERLKLITDMYPDSFYVTYEKGYKSKKKTLGDIEYLLIVLTHVKAQIDSLFVKAVGNYVKQ